MQWLRKPTNEAPTHIASPTLYKNISLLSIVGHGGMGKTTLLQHIYEDLKEDFELKIWVCVSNHFDAKKVIADFEKLRSLQGLNEFNVKNENGYRIGELEHMSEMRKLKIHFLENVKDAVEAGTAKLFEKRKLTDLLLNWGETVDEWKSDRGDGSRRNSVNSNLDVNVLENLKPYKNLKRLSIVSYKGVSSAKWMYNADLISNLEHIRLLGCSEWETLPLLGQLPHLKSLYLCNMPKAKRLDHKFHGSDEEVKTKLRSSWR